MFKTSDLEKIVNYLKQNDVNEFEITSSAIEYATFYGLSPVSIKFHVENEDLQLFSERMNGDVKINSGLFLHNSTKL